MEREVLDSETKKVLFEDIEARGRSIERVSFRPNGSYVATGSMMKRSCMEHANMGKSR